MNKLALAATIAALGGTVSAADGRISTNGPLLTGVALQSMTHDQPIVTALTLLLRRIL